MKKALFVNILSVALLVAAGCFTGCSGSDDPEPTPAPVDVKVTGVTLNQSTLSLTIGEKQTLVATVAPGNATNKNVEWTSYGPSIATVDASTGEVTAVALGTATITVTTADGGKTADCVVTVVPVAVTGITLDHATMFIMVGDMKPLTATVLPENAANKNVIWSSDDWDIAVVNSLTGEILGAAVGTTTITATTEDGEKTAGCVVTVLEVDIETVVIDPGTFLMGSPVGEPGRNAEIEIQHSVTLTRGFRMGKYEITNAQYAAFLNVNDIGCVTQTGYPHYRYAEAEVDGSLQPLLFDSEAQFSGARNWGLNWDGDKWIPVPGCENHPVIYVTWYGTKAFAEWAGGRLPTEAEWEYACRAGTTTAYPFGNDAADLGDYAWYSENAGQSTKEVGTKLANAWGLHDMIGNVFEMCSDWFDFSYGSINASDAVTDPTGPAEPTYGLWRSARGANYGGNTQTCRSAYRSYWSLGDPASSVGFRMVFDL